MTIPSPTRRRASAATSSPAGQPVDQPPSSRYSAGIDALRLRSRAIWCRRAVRAAGRRGRRGHAARKPSGRPARGYSHIAGGDAIAPRRGRGLRSPAAPTGLTDGSKLPADRLPTKAASRVEDADVSALSSARLLGEGMQPARTLAPRAARHERPPRLRPRDPNNRPAPRAEHPVCANRAPRTPPGDSTHPRRSPAGRERDETRPWRRPALPVEKHERAQRPQRRPQRRPPQRQPAAASSPAGRGAERITDAPQPHRSRRGARIARDPEEQRGLSSPPRWRRRPPRTRAPRGRLGEQLFADRLCPLPLIRIGARRAQQPHPNVAPRPPHLARLHGCRRCAIVPQHGFSSRRRAGSAMLAR